MSTEFKVTVRDIVAAEAKVKDFFANNNISMTGQSFCGSGYSGSYSISVNAAGENEIVISIVKKPITTLEFFLINSVKRFLKGV